jgi:hypothetical protein
MTLCSSVAVRSWRCAMILVHARDAAGSCLLPPVGTASKVRPAHKASAAYSGPRGEPAPMITSWRVDRVSYTATPVLSNGQEGAALELRGLFEQFVVDAK